MVHRTRGSLLISLGIALAIMLIVLSVSMPSVQATRTFLLRTEAEKLFNLFYFLQQKALAEHADQTLTFDTARHAYSADKNNHALASGICFGFITAAKGPPSQPTKSITSPVTFKSNTAVFYADGTISAGTVYLVDHERKHMYALTSSISQISFIRMYRYNNGFWILLQ